MGGEQYLEAIAHQHTLSSPGWVAGSLFFCFRFSRSLEWPPSECPILFHVGAFEHRTTFYPFRVEPDNLILLAPRAQKAGMIGENLLHKRSVYRTKGSIVSPNIQMVYLSSLGRKISYPITSQRLKSLLQAFDPVQCISTGRSVICAPSP